MTISQSLAQQIVDATYEVTGRDINFIDKNGIIIGSTAKNRIGDFHEAAHQAILTNKIVEAVSDLQYQGTKMGINYPVIFGAGAIAAIGISGQPEEIRAYGFLVTKITEVFLKEQQLNEELESKQRINAFIITSLIHNDIRNRQDFEQLLLENEIETNEYYRVITIQMNDSTMEKMLKDFFGECGCSLTLYSYPAKFTALLTERQFEMFQIRQTIFIDRFQPHIFAGIGSKSTLFKLHHSYHSAKAAREYAQLNQVTIFDIENISVEILLRTIPDNFSQLFIEKTIGNLNPKERETLKVYFHHNLSLKQSAEALFIHSNTLQYQLNKIAEITGYNPRDYKESIVLYLSLLLSETKTP